MGLTGIVGGAFWGYHLGWQDPGKVSSTSSMTASLQRTEAFQLCLCMKDIAPRNFVFGDFVEWACYCYDAVGTYSG